MNDVKFITRTGLKSAKKAGNHKIDGFLDLVYFKDGVLKEYESNKNFTIGDDGTVMFGDKWGTSRGVFRVAKGFLAAHLGDIGEGFPDDELKHWKKFNVSPSEIPIKERYFDFRKTIRRMIHFMEQSNKRIDRHLTKFFFDVPFADKKLFKLDKVENVLSHIKKVICKETTVDDFQARIIFLNILLLESVNTKLIKKIFTEINKDLRYSYEKLALKEIYEKYLTEDTPQKLKTNLLENSIEPLKSLRLLQKFLLLLKVHHDVITSLKIRKISDLKKRKKEIYNKISDEFVNFYNYKIYGTSFKNKDYFLHNEKIIEDDTKILKLLNQFRSDSAAHGFNQKKYEKILNLLKINGSENDYSKVYEILITRISYDVEHIYFNLICPDPPIKEYCLKYIKETLAELNTKNSSYQSVFEELVSYLYDFPELFPKIIKDVKKEYEHYKNDEKFIIEIGSFIGDLSYIVKDKTQKLVDYLFPGLKFEKALTISHFARIIRNSKRINSSFLDKILPVVYEGLKDNKTLNVRYCSEHVIFCLIKKCPEKLNKKEIKDLFQGEQITFDLIKKYIQ